MSECHYRHYYTTLNLARKEAEQKDVQKQKNSQGITVKHVKIDKHHLVGLRDESLDLIEVVAYDIEEHVCVF